MRRLSPLPYRQRWWAATTLAAAVLLMAGCASRTGPVALACSQLPGAGPLAFVQFENLTIGGQQTRYVARDQLEPFDAPTPQGRYELR